MNDGSAGNVPADALGGGDVSNGATPDAGDLIDAPPDVPGMTDASPDAPGDASSDAPPPDAPANPVCDLVSERFDFATGRNPTFVVTDDFNADGAPDVAIVDFTSDRVSVHLNTTAAGAAVPSFAEQRDFNTGNVPQSAATGDLNGDGKPDIVVPNLWSQTVSIILNTTGAPPANASFISGQIPTGQGPTFVAISDLDRDGKLDLAVSNVGTGNGIGVVSVYLNTTPAGTSFPTFASPVDFAVGRCPSSVAASDLNGDSVPDLVTTNRCDGEGGHGVSILLGTTTVGATTPTYQTAVHIPTGLLPYHGAIGDFNGDWRPDLAVSNYGKNTISVLLNATGFGATLPQFAPSHDVDTGTRPLSIATTDLDRDGRIDIVAAYGSGGAGATIAVLRSTTPTNATTPSFEKCLELPEPGANTVAIADLNRDGKVDLAISNGGIDTFSIYLAK